MAHPSSYGDHHQQYNMHSTSAPTNPGHRPNYNLHSGHLNRPTPALHQVPSAPMPFNQHSNIMSMQRSTPRMPSLSPRPGNTMYPPPPFPPPPHAPPPQGMQMGPPLPQPSFNYTTPPPFLFSNNTIPPQAQPVRILSSNLQVPPQQHNQAFGESCQSHISTIEIDDNLNANLAKTQNKDSEGRKDTQDGKEQVLGWLKKIGKEKSRQKSKQREKSFQFTINDYLCSLQGMNELITRMSSEVDKFESTMSTADKTYWTSHCSEFDELKKKYESMENLLGEQVVSFIAKKMNRINHKRARIKRMRKAVREEHSKIQDARHARDKQINEWQKQIEEEMKQENLKKERKINMDRTLAEVTKKIHDANHLIETMSAVEKLRLIRRDAAEKRGDSELGESRQNVSQKIEDMKRVVKGQLEVYKEEEQALRNAIKLEHEENNKKERKIRRDKEEAEKKEKDRSLSTILFSDFGEADISDPLYAYQEFYKQAQKSLPALIQIRQEWDLYVTSSEAGSPIPSCWIFPSPPSSEAWASALVQE